MELCPVSLNVQQPFKVIVNKQFIGMGFRIIHVYWYGFFEKKTWLAMPFTEKHGAYLLSHSHQTHLLKTKHHAFFFLSHNAFFPVSIHSRTQIILRRSPLQFLLSLLFVVAASVLLLRRRLFVQVSEVLSLFLFLCFSFGCCSS